MCACKMAVALAACLLCVACVGEREEPPLQRDASGMEATVREYIARIIEKPGTQEKEPCEDNMLQDIANDLWGRGPLSGFYGMMGEEADYYVFPNGENKGMDEKIIVIFLSKESPAFAEYTATRKRDKLNNSWAGDVYSEWDDESSFKPYWSTCETYLYSGTVTIPERTAKERGHIRYPEAMQRIIEAYKRESYPNGAGVYEIIIGNYEDRKIKDGRVWAGFSVYERALNDERRADYYHVGMPENIDSGGNGNSSDGFISEARPSASELGVNIYDTYPTEEVFDEEYERRLGIYFEHARQLAEETWVWKAEVVIDEEGNWTWR